MAFGGFQKVVLIVAIGLLILLLIVIAIVLLAMKSSKTWPPETAACPDWWIGDGSGNRAVCKNVKKLGTCKSTQKKFTSPKYTNATGACSKYKWASKCKVSWDGITYGVPNPCDAGDDNADVSDSDSDSDS